VFRFDDNLKVYLHRDPVDFRYGMNSLSILVEQSMRLNPMDTSLYIFGNRRRDRIKILGWDGSGFWLFIKRLESSHFIWPDNKAEIVTMTSNVLHALLDGDDITAIRRHPKQEYRRVS
jgi:transposase